MSLKIFYTLKIQCNLSNIIMLGTHMLYIRYPNLEKAVPIIWRLYNKFYELLINKFTATFTPKYFLHMTLEIFT